MKPSKNKNKKGKFLIYLGISLLLIGAAIPVKVYFKNRAQKEEAVKLEEQMLSGRPQEKSADAADTGDAITYDNALGVIRIDKIGAVYPIFDNTNKKTLLLGVGVVDTTDAPSTKRNTLTVLAGHRGSGRGLDYFLHIGKLEPGDEIKITTRKEILHYRVVGDEVVEPNDWSRFIREEDKTKLYLMSCHPYPKNNKRLLVKADLVKYTEL
ncbi:class C sortase [Aedoeadaptatus pacaensis]|uniref:class C sortase n=1 Tax=Aedoeadaptatus pacaensis TaxID=1776390 RepID=UPI0008386C93|nr:class C sortase [Peptoniphilus pacaensis]